MKRISESSCAKKKQRQNKTKQKTKQTIDVEILVTLRNGDRKIIQLTKIRNSFLINAPLLYPLETSGNQMFVFRR